MEVFFTLVYVKGHPRSLEMAPFKSLGTLFYSHFAATLDISLAVCETFGVKNGVTLKTGLGCLRSSKMVPFDRSYMTFYWSAIVSIVLACIIFEFGIE